MYRARVEAVSGLKVLAGGKWLSCIGNKNVRAGDLIWTDGRCVYGNEQTPQQSHVITPPKEDLAIPVASNFKFYTYQKYLNHNADSEKRLKFLTNNKSGKVYFSNNSKIVAVNVDSSGHRYYILLEDDAIKIVKNGNTVKTVGIPIKDKALEESQKRVQDTGPPILSYGRSALIRLKANFAPQPLEEKPGDGLFLTDTWISLRYTKYLSGVRSTVDYDYKGSPTPYVSVDCKPKCDFAFIEDENNWAVFVTGKGTAQIEYPYAQNVLVSVENVLQGDITLLYHTLDFRYSGDFVYGYFIDNNKSELLFDSLQYTIWKQSGGGNGGGWASAVAGWLGLPMSGHQDGFYREYPVTCNFEKILGFKFPMQDDFHFVVNSLSTSENTGDIPEFMNLTIYKDTSNIFTGTFYTIPNLVACKIGTKFLLAVTQSAESAESVIGTGLYELQNQELTPLDIYPVNQCLRPMKHYKYWWEDIQSLD